MKIQISLLILALGVCSCASPKKERPIKVPYQANEYVHIYNPSGDYFDCETKDIAKGTFCEEWITNDHTIVKEKNGHWHVFALSSPLKDGVARGYGSQASHAVSSTTSFKESYKDGDWQDKPKILVGHHTNHSCNLIEKDGLYYMIYGSYTSYLATSPNLYEWTIEGEAYNDDNYPGRRDPRDPHIFHEGDTYYVSYCVTNGVVMRRSKDLRHWSEPKLIFGPVLHDPESPSIVKYDNRYYLFVCVWDKYTMKLEDLNNAYCQITNVYVTDNLEDGFDSTKKIATLNGHAPEIFQDEEGDWYISSAQYPYRGISVDKLFWK